MRLQEGGYSFLAPCLKLGLFDKSTVILPKQYYTKRLPKYNFQIFMYILSIQRCFNVKCCVVYNQCECELRKLSFTHNFSNDKQYWYM